MFQVRFDNRFPTDAKKQTIMPRIVVRPDTDDRKVATLLAASMRERRPVVILVFADWCGHCRTFRPVFEEFAEKCEFPILDVDVDTLRRHAAKSAQLAALVEDVTTVPHLAIKFPDGRMEKFDGVERTAETVHDFVNAASERAKKKGAKVTKVTKVTWSPAEKSRVKRVESKASKGSEKKPTKEVKTKKKATS